MKSILEELFYGNICPSEDGRSYSKEVKKLMGYVADHYDNLYASLTDEQKVIFEKFNDCQSELAAINEKELFLYAFKLGAQLAMETFSPFAQLK